MVHLVFALNYRENLRAAVTDEDMLGIFEEFGPVRLQGALHESLLRKT